MKPTKKSRFFMFIFSFCPGAAEMYMGFMRMGVSILAAFMIVFSFTMSLSNEVFVCLSFLIYAYGFFHARHLAQACDEEFEAYQDKFFWEELFGTKSPAVSDKKVRKWIAWGLIVAGIVMIYGKCIDMIVPYIPEEVWEDAYTVIDAVPTVVIAIIIIILGIKLIKGKKVELDVDADDITDAIESAADKIIESSVGGENE